MTWLTELLQRPPVTFWDVLDILIVSLIVYELLKLIRGTHAVQMGLGIAVLVGPAFAVDLRLLGVGRHIVPVTLAARCLLRPSADSAAR